MSTQRKTSIGIVCVIAVLLIGWFAFPRRQPLGSSGYDIVVALYSACSAQNAERVAAVASLVDTHLESQQIDRGEADAIEEIIQTANRGDWPKAVRASHQILRSQLER